MPTKRTKRNPNRVVTAEERLKRQAAARISWANTIDRRARAMPGAEAFLQKFIDQVPAEITDPAQRRARGIELRRAHYLKLTAKAVEKARLRREQRKRAGAATGESA
jgi:hypothetical protein